MEQKEKNEKPRWVEEVEFFPEIIRQQVGNTAAGVISTLFQLWLLSPSLYHAVRGEAARLTFEHSAKVNNEVKLDVAGNASQVVDDASKDENL